ncbi:MAG: lipoyl(octanoyl) transferase LipB [Bacteroidales bacterium]|nr:lipoyl(octanoyl) transferase LipB [Bacteroidales bacterium]
MSDKKVIFQDLGPIPYREAWDYQESLFQKIQDFKTGKAKEREQHLLFCEHPHVYTLGKSGSADNLLISEAFMQEKQIEYFHINRGGDITYHGPGQLVGYPIIDLEAFGMGIKSYIFHLEEVIIRTLQEYSVEASRLDGATGVWLDTDNAARARKICAIGVKTSRFVTMHGFAFNINTQLDYFGYINPCGFTDKGVTSLQKELGETLPFQEVAEKVKKNFAVVFDMEFVKGGN